MTEERQPKVSIEQALQLANEGKLQQIREEQETEKMVSKLLDGQPYDAMRIVNETRFYVQQAQVGMFEAGKRLYLLALKEKGRFGKIIERELPLSRGEVFTLVAIYKKFSKVHARGLLGKTKLKMLLSVPDEEIKKLEADGLILGKSLKELELMSTRELQDEIKKYKKRSERAEDRIETAEQKAERKMEAAERLQRVYTLPDDDAEYVKRCRHIKDLFFADFSRLERMALDAAEDPNKFTPASKHEMMDTLRSVYRRAQQLYYQISDYLYLDDDLDPLELPEKIQEKIEELQQSGPWNRPHTPPEEEKKAKRR